MGLEFLYLPKEDIEETGLTMAEIIDIVEEALREKGEGRVEMPPKPGIHPKTLLGLPPNEPEPLRQWLRSV